VWDRRKRESDTECEFLLMDTMEAISAEVASRPREIDPAESRTLRPGSTPTFCVGANGWSDRQLGDGTVIWTAPTGHTYTTKPGGSLYFPVLSTPTGDSLTVTQLEPHPMRSGMMPRRQQSRAEDTASRRAAERRRDSERLALERSRSRSPNGPDDEPPPWLTSRRFLAC
jgi:hypothetical protein